MTIIRYESKFSAHIPERLINEMWRGRHRYRHKHHTPTGAKLATLATGGQYSGAATVGFLPCAYRDSMRLRATRGASRARELADEWNVRRHRGDSQSTS